MKKILGLIAGISLIVAIPLIAGFEDVASDDVVSTKTVKTQKKAEVIKTTQTKMTQIQTKTKTTTPPVVTSTTSKPKSNIAPVPPPPPPPPPQLDIKTLRFSREISGFGYKSSSTTLSSVDSSAKAVLDSIVPLIKKIPNSYKVQVIGYSDGVGPENAEGDKPGNINLSRDRAKAIADYIVRNYGISADRFEIIAKGSADLKDSSSPSSAVNRRVVLKFEP